VGERSVPTAIFGLPLYLGLAILFFALVFLIGLIRGRSYGGKAPRAGSGGIGGKIQMLSAVFGILSFVMQILQWFKII